MAASTIIGQLLSPATVMPASAQVTVTLVDYDDTPVIGFDTADSAEVVSTTTLTPAPTGGWTLQLVPNADIELGDGSALTAYRITESGAGTEFTFWIIVTASADPLWVGALRVTLVGSGGGSAANMAIAGGLTVGGEATFSGGVAIPAGAAAGDVLTSDAQGNATWQSPPGGVPATTVQGAGTYGISPGVGTATHYAREDHQHGTPALTATPPATTLAIGTAAAVGTATTPARADHVHPMASAATPGSSAVGDTAATGSATTPAASDHRHGRESFGSVTALTAFSTASANGSAATPSRSDHVHGAPALPTAATGTAGIAQFESTAASFQPSGIPAAGTNGKISDSGHVHPGQPWQFPITAYGAVGDIVCVIDAVTNGTAVVTSASGKFTPAMVGRTVVGKGFLTSGVSSLVTTIASYQSATQVTLAAAATSSTTGLQMVIGTDDTAHIQAAIDAAVAYQSPFGIAAQVITPMAPGGLGYMIAGPLKNTDSASNAVYNSQLTTGLHSDRLFGLTLEIVGLVDAAPTRHWNQDYPFFTGTSWFSAGVFGSQAAQATSDAHSISNGGNPSCLGGPTGKFGYGVTGTNPQFNNLTVRMVNMSIINTHSASGWSYCPFNFYGTARAHLVRCGFGTAGVVQYYTGGGGSGGNTDFANPSTFSGGASIGGLLPAAGNNADSIIEDCVWNGGFTYGPLIGEHAVCKGMNRSLYNWIGVNVAGTYGDGGSGAGSLHAIDLGQFCVEACSYHLGVWGAGAGGIGPYIKGTLDTEGTVKIRAVTDIAANLQSLMGDLYLTGSPSTPAFDFPTGLRLIKQTQARGPVTSPTYVLGTAQINTFYRDATVTISGGTVTAVKVSALAGGASAPTMTTLAGVTSGTFRVPSGCWWEIDGSVQPTSMQWVLD